MNGQRGSSMVEFVIAATLLMLFVFGIVEFGRALYTYHAVSDAARLGTRFAIVRGSKCIAPSCPAQAADVQTYVRAQAPLIDQSAMTVTTTWPGGGAGCPVGVPNPGCLVVVNVAYPFDFAVPFLSGVPLNMTSTSQMVISR